MGQMKHGTLPTPHVTEWCYLRMRVDGRVVNLGKVRSGAVDVTPSNVTPLPDEMQRIMATGPDHESQ